MDVTMAVTPLQRLPSSGDECVDCHVAAFLLYEDEHCAGTFSSIHVHATLSERTSAICGESSVFHSHRFSFLIRPPAENSAICSPATQGINLGTHLHFFQCLGVSLMTKLLGSLRLMIEGQKQCWQLRALLIDPLLQNLSSSFTDLNLHAESKGYLMYGSLPRHLTPEALTNMPLLLSRDIAQIRSTPYPLPFQDQATHRQGPPPVALIIPPDGAFPLASRPPLPSTGSSQKCQVLLSSVPSSLPEGTSSLLSSSCHGPQCGPHGALQVAPSGDHNELDQGSDELFGGRVCAHAEIFHGRPFLESEVHQLVCQPFERQESWYGTHTVGYFAPTDPSDFQLCTSSDQAVAGGCNLHHSLLELEQQDIELRRRERQSEGDHGTPFMKLQCGPPALGMTREGMVPSSFLLSPKNSSMSQLLYEEDERMHQASVVGPWQETMGSAQGYARTHLHPSVLPQDELAPSGVDFNNTQLLAGGSHNNMSSIFPLGNQSRQTEEPAARCGMSTVHDSSVGMPTTRAMSPDQASPTDAALPFQWEEDWGGPVIVAASIGGVDQSGAVPAGNGGNGGGGVVMPMGEDMQAGHGGERGGGGDEWEEDNDVDTCRAQLQHMVFQGGCAGTKGERPVDKLDGLGVEELRKMFGQNIVDVAKSLGVGCTVLKKHCRVLGISKWPHRSIDSINKLIGVLEGNVGEDVIRVLEQEREAITMDPTRSLSKETKALRQAYYKAEYKRRRLSEIP